LHRRTCLICREPRGGPGGFLPARARGVGGPVCVGIMGNSDRRKRSEASRSSAPETEHGRLHVPSEAASFEADRTLVVSGEAVIRTEAATRFRLLLRQLEQPVGDRTLVESEAVSDGRRRRGAPGRLHAPSGRGRVRVADVDNVLHSRQNAGKSAATTDKGGRTPAGAGHERRDAAVWSRVWGNHPHHPWRCPAALRGKESRARALRNPGSAQEGS